MKKYLIYVSYSLFNKTHQDVWQASSESIKDNMVKSAQEYGMQVEKIEEVV
jgi:hypothetical protein